MAFTPVPRVKNALDNRKLNLNAPCPSAPGKVSSLIWSIVANNPRLVVYTNDPNDTKDYGKISANLDMPVFYTLLAMLDKVINTEGEIKYKLENKNFIFPGGKRSEKPVVTSEIWFGKDKDGLIWISVTARDRPKIKFVFTHSDYHHFQNADGTPVSQSDVSMYVAKGYLSILENMVASLAVANYVEPPKREDTGGNKSSGGGGSYGNKPAAQEEDNDSDIPF